MEKEKAGSIYSKRSRLVVPYSKMGIKILSETQLQNIFPTYETLLDRIEAHRRGLKYIDRSLLENDIQYNLMFDNVYSIMGKRGAGKTSVVFSLKEILQGRNPEVDIVLPIIMPEMIPKDCSMIGWILSLLEDRVKKLNEKNYNYSSDKFNGCLKQSNSDSLIDIYEKTKDLYYAQYYNAEYTESFTDAVVNTDKKTQNSYNFSKQLISFWDALIQAVKSVTEDIKKEPLIHIIFDDVDLVPNAAIMLFSTIIKYLSHPNIVVYVTADEELIFDVIENNMTKRLEKVQDLVMYNHVIGGLKRAYDDEDSKELQSFNDDINKIRKKMLIKEELIHETPKRYGEKVLPPSCRYYLETFESIDKKKNFVVDWHNENTDKDESYTIKTFLENDINRYLEGVGSTIDNNFVQVNKEDGTKEFISAYLLFWGSTSRQLTNEIYIVRELLNRLIKIYKKLHDLPKNADNRTRYCRRVYQAIKDFAYTTLIVSGNVRLRSDEIQDLLNELLIYDVENGGVYIEYLYLRERAMNQYELLSKSRREAALKEVISLFVLSFFIENILKIENSINGIEESEERTKVHGMGLLVDVMDYYVGGEYSLVCKKIVDDVPTFLWYYGKLLDQPHTLLNFDLSVPRTVRDYYSTLSEYPIKKSIVDLYRTSPLWTKTITQSLYFSNERIYNITKKEIDVIRFNREDSYFYDLYYTRQQRTIMEDLIDLLSNLDNVSANDKYKKMYKNIYVDVRDCPEFYAEIELKNGESLGHLHERMRSSNTKSTEETFKKNCALLGRKSSELIFPKEFGTVQCSETLFKELQNIREKIMQCFYLFKFYKIYSIDVVEDNLARISIRSGLHTESIQDVDSDDKDAVSYLISSKELNSLFNQITNAKNINRNRYHLQGEEVIDDIYNEVYISILNQCTSVICSYEELEVAKKAIVLLNYYSTTQYLYVLSYQEQAEETEYHYIDESMIPYKSFYEGQDGIVDRMKKGDYVGLTLRQGIAEKVGMYIQKLSIGSD